jgi:hypothetical protein
MSWKYATFTGVASLDVLGDLNDFLNNLDPIESNAVRVGACAHAGDIMNFGRKAHAVAVWKLEPNPPAADSLSGTWDHYVWHTDSDYDGMCRAMIDAMNNGVLPDARPLSPVAAFYSLFDLSDQHSGQATLALFWRLPK